MTAPKPKVRFQRSWDGLGSWAWECPCGQSSVVWSTSLEYVHDAAAQHSITHTVERVTDELERLAAVSTDCGSSLWIAYRDSTYLIRKHLLPTRLEHTQGEPS